MASETKLTSIGNNQYLNIDKVVFVDVPIFRKMSVREFEVVTEGGARIWLCENLRDNLLKLINGNTPS